MDEDEVSSALRYGKTKRKASKNFTCSWLTLTLVPSSLCPSTIPTTQPATRARTVGKESDHDEEGKRQILVAYTASIDLGDRSRYSNLSRGGRLVASKTALKKIDPV